MSFILKQNEKIDIPFSGEYSKALFGIDHIVFVKTSGEYVLPIENKEAIVNALWFYENKIKQTNKYPYYEGETFIYLDASDKRVLEQVLGLPKEVFDNLDLSKDIIFQLNFSDELSLLKKECYFLLFKEYKKKWYTDDFKLYLLNNGIYFMYDETKPFISKQCSNIPIFINKNNLPKDIKVLLDDVTSERLLIDYLASKANDIVFEKIKKLDKYSFEELLNYFINNYPNEEIEKDINDHEFIINYAFLLRNFLASIINTLYDTYSKEVLRKITSKLSFISENRFMSYHAHGLISLSGFNFDIFSYDNINYFISNDDKERLLKRFNKVKEEIKSDNIAVIYAHLGIPYKVFNYVRDKKINNGEEFVSYFKFESLPYSLTFQIPKRGDLYSYILGDNKHLLITLNRELIRRGVEYSSFNPFDKKYYYESSTIHINVNEKHSEIFDLMCNKNKLLHTDLFLEYQLISNPANTLRQKLIILDEKSSGSALYDFYHMFNNISVEDAVNKLLNKYDLSYLFGKDIFEFFFYLFSHPFDIVYLQVRKYLLLNNDHISLSAIEIFPSNKDTYEPGLPYAYVSSGKTGYSFRESFEGKAYFPLELKPDLEEREKLLNIIANKIYGKDSIGKISFIQKHYGLPDNILANIDFEKDNIFSQLEYRQKISHLALKSEPNVHNNVDDDIEAPYNIYSNYIALKSAKYGLLVDEFIIDENTINYKYLDELPTCKFQGLIHVDKKIVHPILLKYASEREYSLFSLMLSSFPKIFAFPSNFNELYYFIKFNRLKDVIFGCQDLDIIDINSFCLENINTFFLFAYTFKRIELAYAIMSCQKEIPELITSLYCLNYDYQSRLKLPYVHLGRVFNAYSSDLESEDYYFCSCEKETLKEVIRGVYSILNKDSLPDEVITCVTLSLVGLPYVVIDKYADINFNIITPEKFVDNILQFQDNICRRCLNISHAAYASMFRKAYPHKEDEIAETTFATNLLAHNGLFILPSSSIDKIKYSNKHIYNLNDYEDERLPQLFYFDKQPKQECYFFFVFTLTKLNHYLDEFINLSPKIEIAALTSGIIKDAFSRDNEVFYNFIFERDKISTLKEKIDTYFPEISRIRKEINELVCQSILGFITLILEKYLQQFIDEEKKVG